ncbi:MAG: GNAT family N-acetyltransferase, partial [Patescibacteria group bacterium]
MGEMTSGLVNLAFRSGKYVCLRPFEGTDLPFLLRLDNDPLVNEFFVHHRPVTLDLAKRQLEKRLLNESSNVYLGITPVKEHDLFGIINLHRVDLVHGTAWVEIKIAVSWWGKGYGYEALMILLDYAFNQLN